MRKLAIFLLIAVPLYVIFLRAFNKAEVLRPRVLHVQNTLLEAYLEQANGVVFTNHRPEECHIFGFTNHLVIGSTNYQCVLAADSWDYQGSSNLLVITTNRSFLYIDKHGPVPIEHMPPGY